MDASRREWSGGTRLPGRNITDQESVPSARKSAPARGRHSVTTGPKAMNDGPPLTPYYTRRSSRSRAECHRREGLPLTHKRFLLSLQNHPASSDGAPLSSQLRNAGDVCAWRQSERRSSAIARAGPVPAGEERHRSSSQLSNSSGSGSSRTVSSRSPRLISKPMLSGVVLRLRRRRRPSDASRALRSCPQTCAGRDAKTHTFFAPESFVTSGGPQGRSRSAPGESSRDPAQ